MIAARLMYKKDYPPQAFLKIVKYIITCPGCQRRFEVLSPVAIFHAKQGVDRRCKRCRETE